jgi:glycosyltransferase involved in cell wall biosynthesis
MRIAMVAPLAEAIPPELYGGKERAISSLTEELVQRGHEVTLFASPDSDTGAELVDCCSSDERDAAVPGNLVAATMLALSRAYSMAAEFDLIHSHVGCLDLPFAQQAPVATVSTVHDALDLPEVQQLYRSFPEQPLVATRAAQRARLPWANWLGTIPNGIDVERFTFRPERGQYLVYLGRIGPDRRLDRAIEIAQEVGIRLVIAGWVDPADEDYYDHALERLIRSSSLVTDIGEVDEREKEALLGGAYAYIAPSEQSGGSGLAMLEALATGTPLVTYENDLALDIVEQGINGFVCSSLDDLVAAIEQAGMIDRRACRASVENRFSRAAMTDAYEEVYASVLEAAALPAGRYAPRYSPAVRAVP